MTAPKPKIYDCLCGCGTKVTATFASGHRPKAIIPEPVRFWSKVEEGPGGCWIWTAHLNSTGYGEFQLDSRRRSVAHRWSYQELIGPIPDGLVLDHLCRVRNCVNPYHLEPVTTAENNRRGEGITGINSRKTHCKRGHEFTAENTYCRPGKSGRHCRTCKSEVHGPREKARRRARAEERRTSWWV